MIDWLQTTTACADGEDTHGRIGADGESVRGAGPCPRRSRTHHRPRLLGRTELGGLCHMDQRFGYQETRSRLCRHA
jgi:hypothetical protein